jgi:hypothetical protein
MRAQWKSRETETSYSDHDNFELETDSESMQESVLRRDVVSSELPHVPIFGDYIEAPFFLL